MAEGTDTVAAIGVMTSANSSRFPVKRPICLNHGRFSGIVDWMAPSALCWVTSIRPVAGSGALTERGTTAGSPLAGPDCVCSAKFALASISKRFEILNTAIEHLEELKAENFTREDLFDDWRLQSIVSKQL